MSEKFAYNEKGFLLLEHLIAIVIMGVLSITFLHLMQLIAVYTVDQTALTMHEVNTIAIRMQNEVRQASFLTTVDGGLFLHFPEEERVVSFLIVNNRLGRRVNGAGGDILIYNLPQMAVTLFDSHAATVTLTAFSGEVFEFYVFIPHMEVNREDLTESDDEELTEEEDDENAEG